MKVADGMELTVEVTIEGSTLGTYIGPTVAITVHVNIISQTSTGIQMLGCIVGPPNKFGTIADFIPTIHWGQVVFLNDVTYGTEAIHILVVRQNRLASIFVGIGCCTKGLTVAAIIRCFSIDQCAFLLNRQRVIVFANFLIETLYATLHTVQVVCKFAALNTFFTILKQNKLFVISETKVLKAINIIAGYIAHVTRDGLRVTCHAPG